GQVIIHAKFDKDIYLPKDAEFYFVYDGSLKRHVMFAERVSDNALRSIVADLQSLDNDLMMAVAYEELPSTWNILGSCSEEPKHKETLLHLVMKLGLIKLSQFLAAQPGGSSALALPNDDGATPLDLALQNGHSELVKVFTKSCELGIW
ncbi:rho guanine nucleotide exchange factor 28-like, partial [Melopsittacus undulatus]|uniref:rho guanine nucleotide exchange factor 28-like n=1 Tax=Melopsittacus undulatus TaxID=13146 RepID=UPI00146ED899